MLTITTVIMSAVMLVLSVAAGHASPRAVPELMADPITQRTLGTFLATFVFAFVGLVVIGDERSNAGDPLLGLDLLSEIVCRTLSSGVNDVGTAVTCIDYLGSLLAPPSRISADEYPPLISDDGRIAIKRVRFHTMLRHAFRAPARDGGDKAEVTLKILAALTHLARTSCGDYKETIVEEGRQAVDYAKARLALDRDRQAVADAFAGLQEAAGLKPEDRPRAQKRRRKEEHVGVPG